MSSRGWQLRVQDILSAIDLIQQRLDSLDFETFSSNTILAESIVYQFIVIGEASANIPDNIKALAPDLPWRQMSDMRNMMAHEYFRVNLAIVWETAQNNLPALVEPLKKLLVVS
ncbi:DUF86 domain-containing protein [Nodosilinea sp. P-1105]|nr:DUF86 domain-containing protein [Nodosilinea sp. P-1105]